MAGDYGSYDATVQYCTPLLCPLPSLFLQVAPTLPRLLPHALVRPTREFHQNTQVGRDSRHLTTHRDVHRQDTKRLSLDSVWRWFSARRPHAARLPEPNETSLKPCDIPTPYTVLRTLRTSTNLPKIVIQNHRGPAPHFEAFEGPLLVPGTARSLNSWSWR